MEAEDFVSWKARATVEYVELRYRIKALETIMEKRDFPSETPNELLQRQLHAMKEYRDCIEERASIEHFYTPEVF